MPSSFYSAGLEELEDGNDSEAQHSWIVVTDFVSYAPTGAEIPMTTAALQYDNFKKQVAETQKVFTFTNEGEYLVYPVSDHEVIPFWSSRRRVETVQKSHSQYQPYEITEMCLAEFIKWLPQLATEGIHIGTNWSGQRLVGYDVSTQDLQAGIEYWLSRDHK